MEVRRRLRQKCNISALILSVFFDRVRKEKNRGMRVEIKQVSYVADTVLIAEFSLDLLQILNEFRRVCNRMRVKANADMSKVLGVRECQRANIDKKKRELGRWEKKRF